MRCLPFQAGWHWQLGPGWSEVAQWGLACVCARCQGPAEHFRKALGMRYISYVAGEARLQG